MNPNCLKCKYFFITWDKTYPRGCLIFGFKCKDLPSKEVYNTTGAHCPYFEFKQQPAIGGTSSN